jgi:hypothetical protein
VKDSVEIVRLRSPFDFLQSPFSRSARQPRNSHAARQVAQRGRQDAVAVEIDRSPLLLRQ